MGGPSQRWRGATGHEARKGKGGAGPAGDGDGPRRWSDAVGKWLGSAGERMGAGRCDHNEYTVPLGGSAWEDSGAGALVLVGGGAWGESGVVFPVAAVGRVRAGTRRAMRGRGAMRDQGGAAR